MSYSFTVRAATAALAKMLVSAELDKTVAAQPPHAVDRLQAEAAAVAFIDLLPDDASRDVRVQISGYLGGRLSADNTPAVLSLASVSVTAQLVPRQAAE